MSSITLKKIVGITLGLVVLDMLLLIAIVILLIPSKKKEQSND